jgi:hypothetical protein
MVRYHLWNRRDPASRDLFLIYSTRLNTNWVIITTHSFPGGGQIGAISINEGIAAVFDNTSVGDAVHMSFTSNLSAGSPVVSEITARWSGSNILDLSSFSSLMRTWGTDDIKSFYPFGDPQGRTSTSVPDTGFTAVLLALA